MGQPTATAPMMFPPCDGSDLAVLWRELGIESTATREQLLHLTMREVAAVGPAAFNTRTICAQLGVSHPVVHYHFGSRDGLIAEAAHLVYRRYVDLLFAAVQAAPRTPFERLRAFFETGLRLNVEIRGWGAVLNYFSFYSVPVAEIVAERFQADHTAHHERNLALLAELVLDLWQDRVTTAESLSSPEVRAVREQMLADPRAIEALTATTFTLHGLAVWRAGHVVPGDAEASLRSDGLAALTLANTLQALEAVGGTLRTSSL